MGFYCHVCILASTDIPSAFLLEWFHTKNDDHLQHLQRNSLYKKAWSHNVAFQTGMYILFISIVWAEQSQCPLTESSAADRVTTSPADTVTAGRVVSAYRYHQCVEWMEMYICGYIHLI